MKTTKYNIADAALILLDRSRTYGLRHFDQSCLILTERTIDRLKRVIDDEIGRTRNISQPGDKKHIFLINRWRMRGY